MSEGRCLKNMTVADKQHFRDFLCGIYPREAIDKAEVVVSTAPGFDHIPAGEIDLRGVTADVAYKNIR